MRHIALYLAWILYVCIGSEASIFGGPPRIGNSAVEGPPLIRQTNAVNTLPPILKLTSLPLEQESSVPINPPYDLESERKRAFDASGWEDLLEGNDDYAANNIEITRYSFKGASVDVRWFGEDDSILVLTDQNQVHLSSDWGDTWRNLHDELHALVPNRKKSVSIVGVVESFVDADSIILVGDDKSYSFATSDEGESWYLLNLAQDDLTLEVSDVLPHPSIRGRVLVGAKECVAGICSKSLYLSRDWGKSFRKLHATNVHQFAWLEPIVNDYDQDVYHRGASLGRHDRDAIVAVVHRDKVASFPLSSSSSKHLDLVVSRDFFATSGRTLMEGGNRFMVGQGFLFVAKASSAASTSSSEVVDLLVSSDMGVTFSSSRLHPGKTRDSFATAAAFTILDVSESQVFLHVNENEHTGNVYRSDATGASYSLSLRGVLRNPLTGKCDFTKVQGLEGIYLANVLTTDQAATAKNDAFGNRATKPWPRIVTMITFDKGFTWNLVQGGSECKGKKDCSLHFHGFAVNTRGAPIYTSASATGIILASGNPGTHLSHDGIDTYMSRDGGRNWKKIRSGSHIYEFADHGGLVAIVEDKRAVNFIEYSLDQGTTWVAVEFSPLERVLVHNILVEPHSTLTKVLVYGQLENNPSEGVLFMIDLEDIGLRTCQGAAVAGAPASDYEIFQPHAECFLGRKLRITRRKPDALCFNPALHQRMVHVEHCNCVASDYECELGYMRSTESPTTCVRILEASAVVSIEPDPCVGTYEVTQGYRKLAGDSCREDGDSELWRAKRVKCSYVKWSSRGLQVWGVSWRGWLVLVFFVCLVLWWTSAPNLVHHNRNRRVEPPSRSESTQVRGEKKRVTWDEFLSDEVGQHV